MMKAPEERRRYPSRGMFVAVAIVVLLAIAVAGVIWYLRREAAGDGSYIPQDVAHTHEVRLLRDYIRLDTSNPPGNELLGAEFLGAELRRQGIPFEIINVAPGRASLYARVKGRKRGGALMLLNHIDVVPADAKHWVKPPFDGTIAQGVLWGRGTLDMKGIAIAQLLAFIEIAKSAEPPLHDVVFLASPDEESGSRLGMEWLKSNRPDVFDDVRYALTEGGITEVIRENITYFSIEVGSKQFIELRLVGKSKQDLERVRKIVAPYSEVRQPERILPEVRSYFKAIADHRKVGSEVLRNVDEGIAQGKFWLLEDYYRSLTGNYVIMKATKREGGLIYADVILSNLPDEDPEARIAWFKRLIAAEPVEVQVRLTMGPSEISSARSEMFALIAREVQNEYGSDVPVGPIILAYGATDCRFLRRNGVECFGFWPFPVDFFRSNGIHGVNEAIRLDWYLRGVAMMKRVVRSYLSPA